MIKSDSSKPVQERSRRSAQRIVGATEKVLDLHGYTEFSMASVSAGSGMSIGALYSHFANKEALLREVKNDVLTRLELKLEERLQISADSVESTISAFVTELSGALTDQRKLFAFIFAQSVHDAEMRRRGFLFHQRLKTTLRHTLLLNHPGGDKESGRSVDFVYELMVQSLLMRATSLGTVTEAELVYDGFPNPAAYERELIQTVTAYLLGRVPPWKTSASGEIHEPNPNHP